MKPKAANNTRGRAPKAKIVKKELPSEDILNSITTAYSHHSQPKPCVEIVSCISFQKFRYSGENRPGKKYQEKEFMTLKLSNLQDKVVRVVIICTDADNRELIHPNGLVGKDCHDGIYDKEYAVTKPFFLIKIPYLRTERIKTKKNEHEKIQSVLSDRASHLPSPYKERCLSQCTDKYTSSRKFDTTKVCLGVIVTVQSHQGMFNGSLHAISHVVRNASEKTALSILKLSSDSVPASSGGVVDIFTTEDGPAIEPEKYEVFVTCDQDGTDTLISDKVYPSRSEILYKRVITYQIPPFYPNPNLTSPVRAKLHLECPQSNQFCTFDFNYTPEGQIVVLDDQTFGEPKRSYIGDMKPSNESLRAEIFDRGTGSAVKAGLKSKINIKAGLKTKLQARQDPQSSTGTMYIDTQSDSQDGMNHQYIMDHQQQQATRMEGYSRDQSVIIHHQDPQTGETSYYVDMDASKSNSSSGSGNNGTVVFDGDSQHYSKSAVGNFLGMKGMRGKGSPFQSHSQDVEVVAAGYSDKVPPNTTVLIYTTKEGHMAFDASSGEHVVVQEVSGEDHEIRHSAASRHGGKQIGGKQISVLGGAYAAAAQNGTSEQVIRRDTVREPRIVVSESSPRYASEATSADNQRAVSQSFSDHTVQSSASDTRHATARTSYSTSDINSSPSISSNNADRYSPIPTSSPSAIPPIRRMLIPNKAIPSGSPWEVDTREDSSSDYLLVKDYPYESLGKQIVTSQAIAVKKEPMDDRPIIQRSEGYAVSTSTSLSSIHHHSRYPVAEKQLHRLEENGYSQETARRAEASVSVSEDTPAAGKENVMGTLNSLDLSTMIADNLPTMKVFEIAESMTKGLPSTAEETMETDQNH